METIDIDSMSSEQLAQLEAQLEAKKKAEKEKRMNDLKALDQLEDETVRELVKEAQPLSLAIVDFKRRWIERIKPLIEMKISLSKAKNGQEQYQFKTSDGSSSAIIRYNKTDRYDDGINVGIGYAKEWLSQQADTEKSRQLIAIIDDLLSRDRKGNYSPIDLMKFIKSAKEIGDDLMLKAADAVEQCIYEEATSISLLVFCLDEMGVKRQLPLSATKA